jgi:ABC-type transport system involved in multi-copper enzyme maturation permease subunit
MFNLLRRLAARHAFFLLFSLALLGGFQYFICAAVSSVNVSGVLEELMKSLPPFMRSLVGDQFFAGLTTRGILAFGWNHPIALALGTAIGIVLAARAIAGEIESGVLELLLSQPLSRMSYFLAHTTFAIFSLAVLSISGVAGTFIGQEVFGLEPFETGALLKLALNFFLLHCAWFALTMAFSVVGRESGRVSTAGFLVALVSYVVQVIGKLWPPSAFLLPYSLHSYYSPQAILVENTTQGKPLFVLFSISLICTGFAAWRFRRRDIP